MQITRTLAGPAKWTYTHEPLSKAVRDEFPDVPGRGNVWPPESGREMPVGDGIDLSEEIGDLRASIPHKRTAAVWAKRLSDVQATAVLAGSAGLGVLGMVSMVGTFANLGEPSGLITEGLLSGMGVVGLGSAALLGFAILNKDAYAQYEEKKWDHDTARLKLDHLLRNERWEVTQRPTFGGGE